MQNIPKHIQERLTFGTPKHSGSSVNDIPNDTVPPVLEKIIQTDGCESCGRELTETRVVHHKKLINPYTHWSHQCKTCNMFQCAKTGKFTLTNIELRNQHREVHGMKALSEASLYRKIPGAVTGRPTGSKNKPKVEKEPKPRGRPPGAKNKKKSVLLDK